MDGDAMLFDSRMVSTTPRRQRSGVVCVSVCECVCLCECVCVAGCLSVCLLVCECLSAVSLSCLCMMNGKKGFFFEHSGNGWCEF